MQILRTPEFADWFEIQTEKEKAQIDARLKNIELFAYYGDHKFLRQRLWELRWKNGRRIYYSSKVNVLLLVGGQKNAQEKDIRKARKILSRETTFGSI